VNILRVVHENSEVIFKSFILKARNTAKAKKISWAQYDGYSNMYAKVSYGYAITIHKAQGSTYQAVIINMATLLYCKDLDERLKLLYTAITRAAETCTFYKF
jgi:exodeoxyribonuclease-5